MKIHFFRILLVITLLASVSDCGKEGDKDGGASAPASSDNKGIGPVSKVDIGPLNDSLAEKGKQIFDSKCAACHKFEEKVVGPPLAGVTQRRTPEWIMNMILNPQEMIAKDPAAKELFETYLVQMTFQNVSQEDTRAILEYFRQVDSRKK